MALDVLAGAPLWLQSRSSFEMSQFKKKSGPPLHAELWTRSAFMRVPRLSLRSGDGKTCVEALFAAASSSAGGYPKLGRSSGWGGSASSVSCPQAAAISKRSTKRSSSYVTRDEKTPKFENQSRARKSFWAHSGLRKGRARGVRERRTALPLVILLRSRVFLKLAP